MNAEQHLCARPALRQEIKQPPRSTVPARSRLETAPTVKTERPVENAPEHPVTNPSTDPFPCFVLASNHAVKIPTIIATHVPLMCIVLHSQAVFYFIAPNHIFFLPTHPFVIIRIKRFQPGGMHIAATQTCTHTVIYAFSMHRTPPRAKQHRARSRTPKKQPTWR